MDLEKDPPKKAYSDPVYNLERFKVWLDSLNIHLEGLEFVHIAGTRGKGSTAAILEALLLQAGFSVCTFTSPHLDHFGQRFRFNGKSWSREEFEHNLEGFYNSLLPAQRHGFEKGHSYRTVFETLTALALRAFSDFARKEQARGSSLPTIVCWETGLGGRLDCTNVVNPFISIITTISKDHTAILGETIQEITSEKAGIIKQGKPVILSRQRPEYLAEVLKEIRHKAEETGSPVVRSWEHNPVLLQSSSLKAQNIRIRLPEGHNVSRQIKLHGEFQLANLESALAAAWYIAKEFKPEIMGDTILDGIDRIDWPGRFEVRQDPSGRLLIADGAHCPLGARLVAEEASRMIRGTGNELLMIIIGMQKDKDHQEFLRELISNVSNLDVQGVLTIPLNSPRGCDPKVLAEKCQQAGFPSIACSSIKEAVETARETPAHVLCLGSLYSVGEIIRVWEG